jgi:NitT/TauT family transport system permease protein
MRVGFFLRTIAPPLLPLLLWIIGMEFLVSTGVVRAFLIPPPSAVIRSMIDDRYELWLAFLETSSAALLGLFLSFVVGALVAIGLSFSDFLRRAVYPYAIFFQTVPIIAIAPLLVIWFGFGRPTVIASSFIVSVFPIVASTLLGLQSTDPVLVDLFRLYSASRFDGLIRLKLPFALPNIFSGLRIASGLAVIGAIVGEFIAGGGLGALVDAARTQQRIDKVFAAVLVSAALGLAIVAVVNVVSWIALRHWHASAQKS